MARQYCTFKDKITSKNPIVSFAAGKFLRNVLSFLLHTRCQNCLDIGCGRGYVSAEIKGHLGIDVVSADINVLHLIEAKSSFPSMRFVQSDIYNLALIEKGFDVVIALEVLEHLKDPASALQEIIKVSKRWIILSVPHEPYWRMINVARLAYLKDFGNSPGHVHHWCKRRFVNFLERHIRVVQCKSSFLRILALCEKMP